MNKPRVALIHDGLQSFGDPERVLIGLHHIYPNAPVYTSFVDPVGLGRHASQFSTWDLRPLLPKHWLLRPHLHQCRWILPYIWESADLSDYDLVISSTWGYFSHAILSGSQALHVCYCHSPGRYLWDPYRRSERRWWNAWINHRLRRYDFFAAQRVDRLVTNSERAAHRIQKVYRRQAEVIPPPVPVLGHGQAGERYYLYVGPLEAAEQVEMLLAACHQLERPLRIVGTGSQQQRLQAQAGPLVEFLGDRTAADLERVYANTLALVYPKLDTDFGFAAVEAMGRGIPVIAYQQSGMADIVLHYRTGLLFEEPTIDSLRTTMQQFEKLRFFSQACIDRAQEFSETVFASKFEWFVAQALDGLN